MQPGDIHDLNQHNAGGAATLWEWVEDVESGDARVPAWLILDSDTGELSIPPDASGSDFYFNGTIRASNDAGSDLIYVNINEQPS